MLYGEPDPTEVVTIRVQAGVVVGSTSTAVPALDIGTWPVGVSVVLELYGRIQGRGGNGGRGEDAITLGATAGGAGGTALKTTRAITVDYGADAEIWGGGGGGGGGHRVSPFPGFNYIGAGGGGGAGTLGGNGGATGSGDGDATAGSPGTATAGGAKGTDPNPGANGGDGGDPGEAGDSAWTSGGAAGKAIEGVAFVTVNSGTADIRGPTT